MRDLQGNRGSVDLDELEAHLIGLGDRPVLDGADAALPDRLREMLTTFTGRKVQAAVGSGRPEIDASHSQLTLSVTCAAQARPVDAATMAVEALGDSGARWRGRS